MDTDDELPALPPLPLRIGDSDQYLSGLTILQPSILIEITVRDVGSGQIWTSGEVPAPAPLEAFGKAMNAWRASITYPTDPQPPTNTLDPLALQPYCLRYRYVHDDVALDQKMLLVFRLQLYREWESVKKKQDLFPFGAMDRGATARGARKAERRNFNDALDSYLEKWKQNKNRDPYK